MLPLDEWDAAYLRNEVAPSKETASLEKKAASKFNLKASGGVDSETTSELAKQVSAFSNSGDGFLVYGIDDAGNLDQGIPGAVGRTSVKQWVEQIIPTLVFPHVTTCAANFIQVEGVHAADRGALAIFVPLSDRRPHWVTSQGEKTYVRAGEHSLEMRPQTMFDIASRQAAPVVSVIRLFASENHVGRGDTANFSIFPTVRLESGAVCKEWAIEIQLSGGARFTGSVEGAVNETSFMSFPGQLPLLPRQEVRVLGNRPIVIEFPTLRRQEVRVTVRAFAGPYPAACVFSVDEFTKRA